VYADFAAYYGYKPWAHWPYRPQTKGKTEAGVKYVQRNALAGKRFRSWAHLNAWLLECHDDRGSARAWDDARGPRGAVCAGAAHALKGAPRLQPGARAPSSRGHRQSRRD
jgi:hypothetical protein